MHDRLRTFRVFLSPRQYFAALMYSTFTFEVDDVLQVHVFRGLGGNGTPLLALHTAGSMCDVAVSVAKGSSSISGGGDGTDSPTALVAAVGLQHHENQGLLGGHAVAIRVPY